MFSAIGFEIFALMATFGDQFESLAQQVDIKMCTGINCSGVGSI